MPGVYRKIHCAGHIAERKAGPLAHASVRFIEARHLSATEYLTQLSSRHDLASMIEDDMVASSIPTSGLTNNTSKKSNTS